jgi:hypothetical protein
MRAIHCAAHLTVGTPLWHHRLIKGNGNIWSERLLHLNRAFRCEEVHGAIEVTAELRTLFVNAHQRPKGDHLEATRVSQDRSIPLHEFVKAAEALHPLMSWAQIEVIGIRKDDLGAERLQIFWVERLHCGVRADGHEIWRLHNAVT